MSLPRTAIGQIASLSEACCVAFQRRGLTLLLLTVCLAVACRDAVAPAARTLGVPTVLNHEMQALAPVSVQLPFTPLSTVYMTSYAFREGVLVEGRITGFIHVTSDVGASAVHVNDDVDYKGVMDFGRNQCDWSGSISSPQLTVPLGACQTAEPRYSKVQEWRDTILLGGLNGNDVVNARRGGGTGDPQYCPDGQLCHVVSGSQTVTVTPLAADLDVRGFYGSQAARTVFVPAFTHSVGYYAVAFNDSATPRSAKGIPMPFQAISWAWRKTDPNATPDPYWHSTDINQCPTQSLPFYTSNSCNLNVKESGVLTSITRVNGVQHTDSCTVECAEDSLLDNPNIRADLVAALQASDNADPKLRRERGGWIMQDTLTKAYFSVSDTVANASATDCNIKPTNMIVPGANQVGYYHTHPHQAPDSAWSCLDPVTHQPFGHMVMVNPKLGGGGSPSDWSMATEGWPQYIISLHGEDFKLPETSGNWTQAQKDANPNRWWWKKGHGLCTWAAAANL